MSREAAKPRPIAGEPTIDRAQTGTRRIVVEDRDENVRSSSVELAGWPDVVDQDLIPTQPASEPPKAPSHAPPAVADRSSMTVDLPPPSYEEVRDTIPAPPPEHAD